MARAGTAGTHPAFVSMIRELIEERLTDRRAAALGRAAAGRPGRLRAGLLPARHRAAEPVGRVRRL